MKRRHDHGVQKVMAFLLAFVFVFTSVFPYGGVNVKADTTENGLILYYDFDMQNSYATEITDASGNGHTGTLKRAGGGSVEGTYKISTVNIYGNSVKALTLPGGEDGSYLQLPNAILNGNDAVTISMWVNLSTDTGYQRIWDIGNDTTSYLYLLSDGGNKGHEGYAAAITKSGWSNEIGVEKKTNFDKNRWVLTTVVMDGTQMSLYENGQQIGETTDTKISVNDLGATTNNLIGYGQFGDNPTKGQFAEVKIYNKALSADEIAAMYSVDDAGIVAADKDALDLGDTTAVTEDITLPAKGVNGSVITWESTNSAITIADGIAKVTRPAAGSGAAEGKLTATITCNGTTDTKEFDVKVIPMYTDKQIAEDDAAQLEKTVGDLSSVMTDFTLPIKGDKGSVITWESDKDAVVVNGSVAKVTRPEIGNENVSGTLTATVTSGSEKVVKKFAYTVIALKESVSLKDVEEINVTTLKGHSPSLPNYVKATYTDGSVNKIKAVWPASIEADKYANAGNFDVEGSLVGEIRKITAHVTVVDEEEAEKTAVSSNFALKDITLDKIGEDGSILTQNRDRDLAYLKLLDNKRMLYNFYKTFGQTDKIKDVEPLGGWDDPSGLLRGHSTGHYMSALALAYASTGDEEIKAKLDEMVHELRELQKLSKGEAKDFKTNGVKTSTWSTDPNKWGEGFISAYSPDQFALLEQYVGYGSADSGIWAPYYTLHKLIAGFLDAYTYTGNEEALTVATGIGKWVCNRLNACSQEQLTAMWDMYIAGEFGGFNESMSQLYMYTGDEEFIKGAKLFDNTNFFNKLKNNVDDIAGRHANQHIPQIIGALETYEATVKSGKPEVEYYDIAENFWQMTVSRYAYSIGGVGTGEKFTEPYQQANNISGTTNCETCAAYNMLKLTKMLNNYDPDDAEYMDYYERTLYNQILASQTPNVTDKTHNGTTYMLPIGPGSTRDYGGDYDSFTCCHGTGMENHVKYQEAAYVKTADTLYVGLYLPSTVTWEDKGVTVKQETNYPSEDTKLTVSAIEGKTPSSFNMKLRVPYWATNGFTVKVNGEVKVQNPEISTYVELKDVKAGDIIEITMPYTLHLDKTPDKLGSSEVASVMYGPFVMAAEDDNTKWSSLILSNTLSDSIKVSTDSKNGFPVLTAKGYTFRPMFAPEYAKKAYTAYFKVLQVADDGKQWFNVSVNNRTEFNGSITTNAQADMVKEGTDLVITLSPNEGYAVRKLVVNGEEVQDQIKDNVYTVQNVSGDVTVSVSFRPPVMDPQHYEYAASLTFDTLYDYYGSPYDIMKNWEPKSSIDTYNKGRVYRNWYTKGQWSWLQYDWDDKIDINYLNVYWSVNDLDTPTWCDLPEEIRVEYLDDNGEWQKANVNTSYEDSVKLNQYNTISFDTVNTTAIRLNIKTKSEGEAGCVGILRLTAGYQNDIDMAALNATITSAEAKVEKNYTADTWKVFAEALAAAKKVVANTSATQAEVDAANQTLSAAMAGLKMAVTPEPQPQPTPEPQPQPTPQPTPDNQASIKKGDTTTVKGVKYKVTNADKKEVTAYAPKKKTVKSLTISNTVKVNGITCKVVAISDKAFTGMKKLTSVSIPKNVRSIGSKAFYKDSKLKKVKINCTSPKSIGKNAFKGIAKKATIDVPNKQLKTYKQLLKKAKTAGSVKIK